MSTPKHARYLAAKAAVSFVFSKDATARRHVEECEAALKGARYDAEVTGLLHRLALTEEREARTAWEAEGPGDIVGRVFGNEWDCARCGVRRVGSPGENKGCPSGVTIGSNCHESEEAARARRAAPSYNNNRSFDALSDAEKDAYRRREREDEETWKP